MQQIFKEKAIKISLSAFILFAAGTTNAQVGIGIANPNASAQLDVSSTTKGFLPPRMSQAQRNAIVSPTAGLTIWCNDCGVFGELQIYNGFAWNNMMGDYAASPIQPTVTIVDQVWMTKNLDVITYRNGDTIPQVKDASVWDTLTTGAWCYYNNDSSLGSIYGKLYNRYAIADTRGLAPTGWHVPSLNEWNLLINNLGGSGIASDKMRATTLWNKPNNGIGNQSGFTGLPGGYRDNTGVFMSIGDQSYWWSTTETENYYHPDAVYTYWSSQLVGNNVSGVDDIYKVITDSFDSNGDVIFYTQNFPVARNGYSVRCVKD